MQAHYAVRPAQPHLVPVTGLGAGRCHRLSTRIGATTAARGKSFDPALLRIKKLLGQGSFGEVFEGAEAMGKLEHVLNVHVARCAKGSCAEFMGFADVAGTDTVVDKRVTTGTWLLWKYQGSMTLADFLRRRDCNTLLAKAMGVSEENVVPTVMKHLCQSLAIMHAAGLVHRDVKPSNIILCEEDRRLRMIDLGACADLRTGTNYVPDESILDPLYCPPEQYVLPTDAPDLSKKPSLFASALSPMLWARHKPDRFDMYSLGLIFLQLAMPHLRSQGALQAFHTGFKRCRYNLDRWRTVSTFKPHQTAVLDANGGAGWELAEALLRPREVETLADGHVYFTNAGSQRPSAASVLSYAFLRKAEEPRRVSSASEGTASSGEEFDAAPAKEESGFFGMFRKMQSKIFQVEADIIRTAEAAEQQTMTVKRLQKAVEEGRADERDLEKEVGLLQNIVSSMRSLRGDMAARKASAQDLLDQGPTEGSTAEKRQMVSEAQQAMRLDFLPVAVAPKADEVEPVAKPAAAKGWAGMWRSIGDAARKTSEVVDIVQENSRKTLSDMRDRQVSRKQEAAEFMELLAEIGVTKSSTWLLVQTKICRDPRFLACTGERKVQLFRSYIGALDSADAKDVASKVEGKFADYVAEVVTDPATAENWSAVKTKLLSHTAFSSLSEANASLIYERHVRQIREQAGRSVTDAEANFRTLLNGTTPAITGDTSWPQVRRMLWQEPGYLAVPDVRRREIFNELREIMRDIEATQGMVSEVDPTPSPRVIEADPTTASQAVDPVAEPTRVQDMDEAEIMQSLRAEQAKLKAEYERMESKLAAMESRIQGKDSGDDSDSDTEPIEEPIRLLSKLSTAASRRPLSAHTRANGVSREWPRSKSGPP